MAGIHKGNLWNKTCFMLKTVGNGEIFVNAWGGIISHTLQPGEKNAN